jgi:hypothetical protein
VFLDAPNDQLLDQGKKPADELVVEGLGKGMVFEGAVVIEA